MLKRFLLPQVAWLSTLFPALALQKDSSSSLFASYESPLSIVISITELSSPIR